MTDSTITVYENQDGEWFERIINLNDIPDCTSDDFDSPKDFCEWANGNQGKSLDDNGAYWIEPLD